MSLKTYVTEVMKGKSKDVNENETKDVNENETKNINENETKKFKESFNDAGNVMSKCVVSSSDDFSSDEVDSDESFEPRKKSAKSVIIPKILKQAIQVDKTFSDNYDDSCLVECSICDKQMAMPQLRSHTSSQHQITITKYKERFGPQLTFTRETFHLCKLCGVEILLDSDSIAAHVRRIHKWTLKQYNDTHMMKKVVRHGLKKEKSIQLFLPDGNFSHEQFERKELVHQVDTNE